MNRDSALLLAIGGVALYYIYTDQGGVQGDIEDVGNEVTAAVEGWQNAGSGPEWMPYLNQAESQYGLPQNMLARQAFEESSFSESVIRGTRASSAGAMGIMQLMPQYFSSVNVPTPYTDEDVSNQIEQAAQQMASLYQSTGSWLLALAAYNAGLGTVQQYSGIPPYPETQKYVADIAADVPAVQYG